MKIVGRILGALGGVIVLAVVFLVVKFFILSPKMRPAPNVTAPKSAEAIARGKYLVDHVAGCLGCHSPVQDDKPGDFPVDGMLGAGRDFGEMPGTKMRFRSHNLTADKETGIGDWTDGEVLRAMREGVSRDGRTLFPQMPYITYAKTLSDDDALAIIAYIRTLAPIKHDPGKTEIPFPVSMFVRAAPQPVEKPLAAAPPPSDKMARGKWLLATASCHDCHDSYNDHHEPIAGKELGGGMRFPLGPKGTAIAPNISSDKATGIGAYTDEDLTRAIEEGKGKNGRNLYVMPWSYYRGMTKEDKDALFAALRAEPAVSNLVPPSEIK